MGVLSTWPAALLPPLALITTQGGFVDVHKTTAGGVTVVSYEAQTPLLVALGCLAACGLGWFLTTKRLTKQIGWIMLITAIVVFFLTVPAWMQEKIRFDDHQVSRVMSRWFFPSTREFQWDDLDHVDVTDVVRNEYKKRNRTYVKFVLTDGRVVDWGNVTPSPLVGEVIEEILQQARQRGIRVETDMVEKRESAE